MITLPAAVRESKQRIFLVQKLTIDATVIRNQMKSLYRYGRRSNCEGKFEEFKFCLTLKVMHPEEQREAWIRRRAEWWAKRRIDKSSEDVWDMRECVLSSGKTRLG